MNNNAATNSGETIIWTAHPSHATNFNAYFGFGILFFLVFPLFIILWKWLQIDATEYILTTERLKLKEGVINRDTDDLELYRVRDYRFEQPLSLRVFGLGNIVLDTADHSHPVVMLHGVKDGERLLNDIRKQVEICRIAKGVRMLDME